MAQKLINKYRSARFDNNSENWALLINRSTGERVKHLVCLTVAKCLCGYIVMSQDIADGNSDR